jgi:hypothetical protein
MAVRLLILSICAIHLIFCQVAVSEKEAALGAAVSSQFAKDHRILQSEPLQVYLAGLARRIDSSARVSIQVFAGESCGAPQRPVAIPGGFVFVPTALLLESVEERQFAELLAAAIERSLEHRTGWIYRGDCSALPAGAQTEQAQIKPLPGFDPSPAGFTAAQDIVRDLVKVPVPPKPSLFRSGRR